ncbi:ribose ABC transporter permease [candidate division KSB3 bacterium]|uniref:Ribose ABC transporter permease n=1 Tax=candidate division KSB3 bacterium TaxID=2044937 RepID=A0A2G6KB08_9BACT|nr:MAG: ribose ABC transporter permease [candidate division KSB3 bacterium]
MKRKFDFTKYAPLFALIILCVISALASPYFLKTRNLLNILRQVSYTGVIGLGMTFVIISGGIDLSVGSMVALVGGIAVTTLNYFGGGTFAIFMAILTGSLVGILCGMFNGLIVTKGRIAPFIVTLGTMSIFRSLTLYIKNAGEFRSESALYPKIGAGFFLGMPIPVWVFLVLAILFQVLLSNTRYGRYVCAVGSNEQVALYSAIKVNLIKFFTYVLTGLTVGVSAVMLSARLNSISSTNAGVYYELDAIAAVVIGGTSMSGGSGTIYGTVIGAIILGIINNMLNMLGVSPYLQGTVKGLVIILAVLLQYKKKN